jgi:primosomal protein N' (replication factor Y)
VEAELSAALDVPVFRLDADTAGSKDAVPELLARFKAAPAGLLLGTQMVAKGHDFPDVTLGVVVDADSTLRFPDFRAEERTFADRPARGARRPRSARRPGPRTSTPDAVDQAAARHDWTASWPASSSASALRYPPFADLVRVVCSAPDAAARTPPATSPPPWRRRQATTELLGPAPLFRRAGASASRSCSRPGSGRSL